MAKKKTAKRAAKKTAKGGTRPSRKRPPAQPAEAATRTESDAGAAVSRGIPPESCTVPAAELLQHRDAGNVRLHPDRNLRDIAASIDQFGFGRSVVMDAEGIIRAGNGTVEAAARAGATARVIEVDGSELVVLKRTDLRGPDAVGLAIADNRTQETSKWDEDALAQQLQALPKPQQDASGFSEKELGRLLEKHNRRNGEVTEAHEIEQSQGERLKEKWGTATGQVWRIDGQCQHVLRIGDSLEQGAAEAVRELVGGLADAVVTDPPYAIYGSSTGVGESIADDSMVRPFFESMFRVVIGSCKEFGHVYIFCDWRSWASLWEMLKRTTLAVKNMLVMDKGSGLGNQYSNCHELVMYAVPMPLQGTMKNSNARTGMRTVERPNVIRCTRESQAARFHNAAKPASVVAELVRNATDERQTVLDLFGGSGQTLLACEQLGRRCVMGEKESDWAAVILERCELEGLTPTLET